MTPYMLAALLVAGVPMPRRKNFVVPPRKKCFRDGCSNLREGNKLFCSKECYGLHAKTTKAQEKMQKMRAFHSLSFGGKAL